MPGKPIALKEDEGYQDGLLWIGGSYRSVECGAKDNCAVPTPAEISSDRGKAQCFVHEAEWRGISRKVPSVPAWAVPGETRIFLAHRSGLKGGDQGKIFGYFVLHRVEVLGEAGSALTSPDIPEAPGEGLKDGADRRGRLMVSVYDAATGRPLRGAKVQAQADGMPPGDVEMRKHGYRLDLSAREHRLTVSMSGYQPATLAGIGIPSGQRREVAVYLRPGVRDAVKGEEGKERTEKCWDGTRIVTHRFSDGKWHRTRQQCPDIPAPPPCKDGAIQESVCADGSLIPVRICFQGEWLDTGVRCAGARPRPSRPGAEPTPVDIDIEPCLPHRSCSLRLRPGAVYLVDALCAEIYDRFSKLLRRQGLPGRFQEAPRDAERREAVLAARQEFVDLATKVSGGWKTQGAIPGPLAGRASQRGGLVLFAEPVLFVKQPRAAFRGLERIDGDHLLGQIADGVAIPTVRVYVHPARREPMLTRHEIAERLAEKERTTRAAVEEVLDALAAAARDELASSGAVRLPGIGDLRTVPTPAPARPAAEDKLETKLAAHLEKENLLLGGQVVHQLLDDLGRLATNELAAARAFRLPRIGTLRRRNGRIGFAPAKALAATKVTLVSPPGWL